MSKPTKNKKDKVPKITEEEYAAYLSALKELGKSENDTINADMGASSNVVGAIKKE